MIKMERNGRCSCTGNSRHIGIRFFFVKDRVDKGELFIQYFKSMGILVDYFTKPLQGFLFRVFRQVIMGQKTISWLKNHLSVTKERIDKSEITKIVPYNKVRRKIL